jgi:hypothetical protein
MIGLNISISKYLIYLAQLVDINKLIEEKRR